MEMIIRKPITSVTIQHKSCSTKINLYFHPEIPWPLISPDVLYELELHRLIQPLEQIHQYIRLAPFLTEWGEKPFGILKRPPLSFNNLPASSFGTTVLLVARGPEAAMVVNSKTLQDIGLSVVSFGNTWHLWPRGEDLPDRSTISLSIVHKATNTITNDKITTGTNTPTAKELIETRKEKETQCSNTDFVEQQLDVLDLGMEVDEEQLNEDLQPLVKKKNKKRGKGQKKLAIVKELWKERQNKIREAEQQASNIKTSRKSEEEDWSPSVYPDSKPSKTTPEKQWKPPNPWWRR